MNNIQTQLLTKEIIFDSWLYDSSTDQYHIETDSHGFIVYIPDEDTFIVNEGTLKEYEANLQDVNELINPTPNKTKSPNQSTPTKPVENKLSAHDLHKKVSEYETYKNIYMNFSLDNNKVWGLPEGSKTLHALTDDKINEYNQFLNDAIKNYTNLSNFFTNDLDYQKKLKKYKLYQRRLNNIQNVLL
jgi:hypothetical protein